MYNFKDTLSRTRSCKKIKYFTRNYREQNAKNAKSWYLFLDLRLTFSTHYEEKIRKVQIRDIQLFEFLNVTEIC